MYNLASIVLSFSLSARLAAVLLWHFYMESLRQRATKIMQRRSALIFLLFVWFNAVREDGFAQSSKRDDAIQIYYILRVVRVFSRRVRGQSRHCSSGIIHSCNRKVFLTRTTCQIQSSCCM